MTKDNYYNSTGERTEIIDLNSEPIRVVYEIRDGVVNIDKATREIKPTTEVEHEQDQNQTDQKEAGQYETYQSKIIQSSSVENDMDQKKTVQQTKTEEVLTEEKEQIAETIEKRNQPEVEKQQNVVALKNELGTVYPSVDDIVSRINLDEGKHDKYNKHVLGQKNPARTNEFYDPRLGSDSDSVVTIDTRGDYVFHAIETLTSDKTQFFLASKVSEKNALYGYNKDTNTIIIINPSHIDHSTMYRPCKDLGNGFFRDDPNQFYQKHQNQLDASGQLPEIKTGIENILPWLKQDQTFKEYRSQHIDLSGTKEIGQNVGNLPGPLPTQFSVDPKVVATYESQLIKGEKVPPIEIAVSRDGKEVLIEGHHRYVASQNTGIPIEQKNNVSGVVPAPFAWNDVTYEDLSSEELTNAQKQSMVFSNREITAAEYINSSEAQKEYRAQTEERVKAHLQGLREQDVDSEQMSSVENDLKANLGDPAQTYALKQELDLSDMREEVDQKVHEAGTQTLSANQQKPSDSLYATFALVSLYFENNEDAEQRNSEVLDEDELQQPQADLHVAELAAQKAEQGEPQDIKEEKSWEQDSERLEVEEKRVATVDEQLAQQEEIPGIEEKMVEAPAMNALEIPDQNAQQDQKEEYVLGHAEALEEIETIDEQQQNNLFVSSQEKIIRAERQDEDLATVIDERAVADQQNGESIAVIPDEVVIENQQHQSDVAAQTEAEAVIANPQQVPVVEASVKIVAEKPEEAVPTKEEVASAVAIPEEAIAAAHEHLVMTAEDTAITEANTEQLATQNSQVEIDSAPAISDRKISAAEYISIPEAREEYRAQTEQKLGDYLKQIASIESEKMAMMEDPVQLYALGQQLDLSEMRKEVDQTDSVKVVQDYYNTKHDMARDLASVQKAFGQQIELDPDTIKRAEISERAAQSQDESMAQARMNIKFGYLEQDEFAEVAERIAASSQRWEESEVASQFKLAAQEVTQQSDQSQGV